MPLFKGEVRYEMKQFVAAAFVSNEEIKNEDIGIIQEADYRLKKPWQQRMFMKTIVCHLIDWLYW